MGEEGKSGGGARGRCGAFFCAAIKWRMATVGGITRHYCLFIHRLQDGACTGSLGLIVEEEGGGC